MLIEIMSPIGLFSIVLSLVLVSLVPALVVKGLMVLFFATPVTYGMVLVGHIISGLFIFLTLGLTEIVSGRDLDAMSNSAITAWTIGCYLFQALCLNFIATGPGMVMIGMWKWTVVLALQYAVYFLVALALVLVLH